MSPTATRGELPLPIRLAVSIAVLLVLGLLAALVVRGATQVSGTRLSAVFPRAGQGLDTSSPVKIRGVTVGGVGSVTLDRRGRAVVAIHVDPGFGVPLGVTATIEPSSVFGPKYVNLIPGPGEAAGPYLADGAVITRTEAPSDLSDILADAHEGLGAVDPRDVTVVVHTLGRGLDGKGPRLREILDDTGRIVEVAHRRRDEFRRFVADAGDLADALSDKGDELVAVAADANAITPGLLKRAGRARALLGELDDVSRLTAHGLRGHRRDLKAAGTSGERVASLLYAQLGVAGDGVRRLNHIFTDVNDLVSGRGPDGANQIKMEAFIATDVCELIVGACGPSNGR
ncbi:MCE family protein [Streptosporangium sp. NPDC023615]|uniref:MCE family protein n=1 Tax=Streptosporangium sp. NPDC023615 TaxID=3154794 RepID=UPI00341D1B52